MMKNSEQPIVMIVDLCLFHYHIPIELRQLIHQHISATLDNNEIKLAVTSWVKRKEYALLRYGDIRDWNTTHVTQMNGLFAREYSDFNEPITQWDVSNVVDMSTMFFGATLFNQSLESWDVSNVTKMAAMFHSASSFNQPLDKWNVGHVTNMMYMFSEAKAFNQALDTWDVSNCTDMKKMFAFASSFNQTRMSVMSKI